MKVAATAIAAALVVIVGPLQAQTADTGPAASSAPAAEPAPAAAPEAAPASFNPAASVFPQGWYVAPMFSYDKVDPKRCTNDGVGGAVAVGNHADYGIALELGVQYLSLDYDCSYSTTRETGTAQLEGLGFSLLAGPYFELPVLRNMYGILGVGSLRHINHPRFGQDASNFTGDAGVGYLQPFTLWGWSALLRAEARYRYESERAPHYNGSANHLQDVIFNVGLQIPLFAPAAAPPPAAEQVAVVPAAEPQPAPAAPAPAPVPAAAEPPAPAPVTIETAKAGDTVVLHGVNFETGKAVLTSNAKTILDGVAKDLNARAELKVEIGGHTDARGKPAYNRKLSDKRAKAVQDYLEQQGVAAERLSAKGYGKTQPIDSNETDEGRERNRRVELKVLQ